jgi:ferredoxin
MDETISRVAIDHKRCTGHGRCYTLAPSLFEPDEEGYGRVIGDGAIAGDAAGAASALANCPEGAISLVAAKEPQVP